MSATNKINARDFRLYDVLHSRRYSIDYFQREYSWELKHIEQLVTDLCGAFLNAYNEGDMRQAVENYACYYLGPFVISNKETKRSIVDGQQRLTSLTLFLIYLNHLQKKLGGNESLEGMILSSMYGTTTFNIQEEKLPGNTQPDDRQRVFNALWKHNEYVIQEHDSATARNIAQRYTDIANIFPEELLNAHILPYFLDWLRYNVIMVEIAATSDDSAYDIFESMNDRGLNLTATEMLKGFLISRFSDVHERDTINQRWKNAMLQLQSYGKEEDQKFFQAMLRSQYADTIRQGGKVGSQNEDFEKIGTRFHSWVRDNLKRISIHHENEYEYKTLISTIWFYHAAYLRILEAQKQEQKDLIHIFYHSKWGVAESLSYPLMLAPLTVVDDVPTQNAKMNLVARYLETFAVLRSVNFRNFSASSIRYTMYALVKEIRGKNIDELHTILTNRIKQSDVQLDGITKQKFRLHGMNRSFVKFLLSRISGFVDTEIEFFNKAQGHSTNFTKYYISPGAKPFEVEHIWSVQFDQHRDEFDQQNDYEEYRNYIGALVLLPRGTNQSFGDMPYAQKLEKYYSQNSYVQTLHPKSYISNPNFLQMIQRYQIPFEPHLEFKKADIDKRQALVQRICEVIWAW